MSFEADHVMIPIALERGELSGAIDDALAHSSPLVIFISSDNIFNVAMADSTFRQKIVGARVGDFPALGRICPDPS